MYVCMYLSLSLSLSIYIYIYIYTCRWALGVVFDLVAWTAHMEDATPRTTNQRSCSFGV